ncbi:dihydrofolate reductase [Devosia nitrariae]|uniref:Dihydrofolate reductase n=1 Tax=Devosia nitrariae TaxID=2071872 RepID=A0ABQ5W4J3_9HYPH|nr:dihydrofolate reductase [Devosia nitrariae]GLQ54565.1 dihydrofolate reductase [Devosia nitrariae]
MSVKIAMIAAVAENGVIGRDQTIPWRIPSDMAYFKRTTMGKPIVMGRKQYETVGKPLPGRTNIVVTRQTDYRPDGVIVMNDLETAIARAKTIAEADGVGEVMILGGGEIYRQAMPLADRLYISHVALSPDGDVTFPAIDPDHWRIVDELAVPPSEKDAAAFRVKVYERRSPAFH